jgi:DNA polymerase-1
MKKKKSKSKSPPSLKATEGRGKRKKRLVLIDGHSILFRAFHAYPHLTTSKGELVNAVYGFTNILLTVIRDLGPTHIAVSFDREEPTFRHEEYEGYKAHRPEAPVELTDQQDRVEEIVSVLNIPIFAVEGFEADDVIGTLAFQAKSQKVKSPKSKVPPGRARGKSDGIEVVIVTGDQDMFQVVDSKRVLVYTPARGKQKAQLWDAGTVTKKYGLKPSQLVDLKAMAGDASDAIPGVKGIGPKTATKLLLKYETLERIYKHLDSIKNEFGSAAYQKLVDGKESAFLSKKLGAIVLDVPIKLSLRACVVHDYDKTEAVERFKELEFTSLIKKLPNDGFEQMVQDTLFSNTD